MGEVHSTCCSQQDSNLLAEEIRRYDTKYDNRRRRVQAAIDIAYGPIGGIPKGATGFVVDMFQGPNKGSPGILVDWDAFPRLARVPVRAEQFTFIREEEPGPYVLTRECAVTPGLALSDEIITTLSAGDTVNVLEVVHRVEDQRWRARIEEPSGWISLCATVDGQRWAGKSMPRPANVGSMPSWKQKLPVAPVLQPILPALNQQLHSSFVGPHGTHLKPADGSRISSSRLRSGGADVGHRLMPGRPGMGMHMRSRSFDLGVARIGLPRDSHGSVRRDSELYLGGVPPLGRHNPYRLNAKTGSAGATPGGFSPGSGAKVYANIATTQLSPNGAIGSSPSVPVRLPRARSLDTAMMALQIENSLQWEKSRRAGLRELTPDRVTTRPLSRRDGRLTAETGQVAHNDTPSTQCAIESTLQGDRSYRSYASPNSGADTSRAALRELTPDRVSIGTPSRLGGGVKVNLEGDGHYPTSRDSTPRVPEGPTFLQNSVGIGNRQATALSALPTCDINGPSTPQSTQRNVWDASETFAPWAERHLEHDVKGGIMTTDVYLPKEQGANFCDGYTKTTLPYVNVLDD